MGAVSISVVFIMSWWTSLFVVLPWGIKYDEDHEPGHMPGAPSNPNLKKKFMITTVIAIIITFVVYFFIKMDVINFYEEANNMMIEDRK